MKVVILAGGLGTRISEESHLKPKPMIEIGKYPILVHIMQIYSKQGFDDFIICAGYKQEIIKDYFSHFENYFSDVTFDFANGNRTIHRLQKYNWTVTVSDTGLNTMTGGRLARIKKYIDDELFLLTYGDGVGNVDINAVIDCHKKSKKKATICVYNFGESKGVVDVDSDGNVRSFREKSDSDGDLINIGFMVVNSCVLNMIDSDNCNFEKDILPVLAKQGQLNSYVHTGFWQCMDTLKEKEMLDKLALQDDCPWKINR